MTIINLQSQPRPENLDALCADLIAAKRQRDQVTKQIHDLEAAIAKQIECKTEGSATTKTERYKITSTGSLARKVDESQVSACRKALGRTIFNKVFPAKHSVTKKELDYLQNNEPELFYEALKIITTTPRKTAVKVEVI